MVYEWLLLIIMGICFWCMLCVVVLLSVCEKFVMFGSVVRCVEWLCFVEVVSLMLCMSVVCMFGVCNCVRVLVFSSVCGLFL